MFKYFLTITLLFSNYEKSMKKIKIIDLINKTFVYWLHINSNRGKVNIRDYMVTKCHKTLIEH